jgi:acetyl esterase/lipase
MSVRLEIMTPDRRTVLGLGAALAAAPAAATDLDPTEVIRLWPASPPGAEHATARLEIKERSPDLSAYRDRIAIGVADPLMTVFRPAQPNGSAVVIIPGGGYRWVVIDKEGFEAARRLNQAGVTCFVLRYRLPGGGWAAGPDAPLQDAQRAMRLIRAGAKTWGLDPARVGLLGFSAGGHLGASLAELHARATYAPVDAADALSARPAFAGLMYPVISMGPFAHSGSREELLGKAPTAGQLDAVSREKTVTADMPPVFLVHAMDDRSVPVENSLMLASALRANKVPVEVHLFEEGDHGFGIRLAQGKPCAAWPELFLAWGRRYGL